MMKIKNLFAALKAGQEGRHSCILIEGNQKCLMILNDLEKDNLIRGYQIIDICKYKICIYLKYNKFGEPILKELKSFANNEKIYLKKSLLNNINDTTNLIYVTTKIGLEKLNILKHQQRKLNQKMGGEIKYLLGFNKLDIKFKELIKK